MSRRLSPMDALVYRSCRWKMGPVSLLTFEDVDGRCPRAGAKRRSAASLQRPVSMMMSLDNGRMSVGAAATAYVSPRARQRGPLRDQLEGLAADCELPAHPADARAERNRYRRQFEGMMVSSSAGADAGENVLGRKAAARSRSSPAKCAAASSSLRPGLWRGLSRRI